MDAERLPVKMKTQLFDVETCKIVHNYVDHVMMTYNIICEVLNYTYILIRYKN